MKNRKLFYSRIIRLSLCLIFLYIVFSCACTLTLEINQNSTMNVENKEDISRSTSSDNYKTLLVSYYQSNELQSEEAKKCFEKIQKEAISLVINKNQQQKEGVTYYIWELKKDPIVEVSNEMITVCIELTYKSKKSSYEPNYIVSFKKENNRWEEYVKRTSYNVIFDDYYDTNVAIEKLNFEGFFDIELVSSNDYDKFKNVFFFHAKKFGSKDVEFFSIKVNADYDTINDLWTEKITVTKISNNEIVYKRVDFQNFSIEIPNFWNYVIESNSSFENPSKTIIISSINNCSLYIKEIEKK